MIIGADAERQYIRAIFGALGASEAERNALAEVLTEADLRGYPSHGFIRIVSNATMMKNGDLDRGAEPHILRETGPTAVIDGARTNGPYAATFAARDAVQRARAHGIGAVALQECGHLGIAGYYVELMAREGLVGLLFAKSESSVHPHGGIERLLGTNPVAIAIPW